MPEISRQVYSAQVILFHYFSFGSPNVIVRFLYTSCRSWLVGIWMELVWIQNLPDSHRTLVFNLSPHKCHAFENTQATMGTDLKGLFIASYYVPYGPFLLSVCLHLFFLAF